MAKFEYKKNTVVNLKASGMLDVDALTIEIDGTDEDIKSMLKPFDGLDCVLSIQVKNTEELELPTVSQ